MFFNPHWVEISEKITKMLYYQMVFFAPFGNIERLKKLIFVTSIAHIAVPSVFNLLPT